MISTSVPTAKIASTARAVLLVLLLAGCHSGGQATSEASSAQPPSTSGAEPVSFSMQSSSFPSGGEIPKKFSCEGADVSPALEWGEPPAKTQSFVLIADDPDAPAGTWTHWVAYDLPANLRQLPEAVPKQATLTGGGAQGLNDFGKIGYGGPCPPPGKPHRYFFKLHALDAKLNLKPGASKQQVEQAMEGHILNKAELMGTYKR
jgi:Raf kinase inhibitor-like YbhB/YbcL family protein